MKEQPVNLDHTPGHASASARSLASFDERVFMCNDTSVMEHCSLLSAPNHLNQD